MQEIRAHRLICILRRVEVGVGNCALVFPTPLPSSSKGPWGNHSPTRKVRAEEMGVQLCFPRCRTSVRIEWWALCVDCMSWRRVMPCSRHPSCLPKGWHGATDPPKAKRRCEKQAGQGPKPRAMWVLSFLWSPHVHFWGCRYMAWCRGVCAVCSSKCQQPTDRTTPTTPFFFSAAPWGRGQVSACGGVLGCPKRWWVGPVRVPFGPQERRIGKNREVAARTFCVFEPEVRVVGRPPLSFLFFLGLPFCV